MSIILNSKISNDEKDYYNNVTKSYGKFFTDNYYLPTLTNNQLSNWTSITVNESNGFMMGIASNSNATSTHNIIYSSDGGLTWSSSNITSNNSNVTSWKDITYDGVSKYVAVGNYINSANNYILVLDESLNIIKAIKNGTDGTETKSWTSVIYAAGFFVTVCEDRVMISSDANTWTPKIIPDQSWKKVVYGKDIFVAVATSGDNKLIYSKDNWNNWDFCAIDTYIYDISNQSIVFCSKINKFILSFYYSDDSKNYIYYSDDAINWTKSYEFDDSIGIVKSLVWSQELELIIISCYSSSDFNIMFSNDGINWLIEKTNYTFSSEVSEKIIWNRFFSNFVIITDKKSSGALITTKILGVNNLLQKSKYYDVDVFNKFEYSNNYIRISAGQYFAYSPDLNIKNENIQYSISPALPTGISFNTYNGIISGSYEGEDYFPKTEFTVTANELVNNQKLITKIYLEFLIQLYAITIFEYYNNQPLNLIVDATSNLIHTPVIVGSPEFEFIINNNPNSSIFSINSDTGVLTISPTSAGQFTLNITVSNIINSFTTTFSIIIKNKVPGSFNYGSSPTLVINETVSQTYSPTTNVAAGLTYLVSSNISSLPGSSINSTTGVLTIITPSSPVIVTLTITAQNESGQATSQFSITVINPVIEDFTYIRTPSPDILSIDDETDSETLYTFTPSYSTGANITYSISPPLPTGFSLNTSTGIITGTPTTYVVSTVYTITATSNGVDSATEQITIFIRDSNIIIPSGLSYNDSTPLKIAINTVVSPGYSPTILAGTSPTYTTNPSLPGLTINSSTGVISGTVSSSTSSNTPYTITAQNSSGSTTFAFYIRVYTSPYSLTYNNGIKLFLTKNVSMTSSPAISNSNEVEFLEYSVSPPLPVGLSLNTSTGVVSGTPTGSFTDSTYTITVSNSVGSTTFSLLIKVYAAPTGITYSDQISEVSTSVSYSSPTISNSSDVGPLTYNISPSLPSDLSLNTSSGAISGTTPSTVTNVNYTVTASNLIGSVSNTIRIRIVYKSFTLNYGSRFDGTSTFYGYSSNANYGGGATYGSLSNSNYKTTSIVAFYTVQGYTDLAFLKQGAYNEFINIRDTYTTNSFLQKVTINGTTYNVNSTSDRFVGQYNPDPSYFHLIYRWPSTLFSGNSTILFE
jgi:hypothetical protein